MPETSDKKSFPDRRGERTRSIDKILRGESSDKYQCASDGNHCGDHPVNMYRIELLEDAKDALCVTTNILTEQTTKNTSTMKVVGIVLTTCAAFVMVATGLGWTKLVQFTEKIYMLRESDHETFESYQLDAQKTHLLLKREILLLASEIKEMKIRYEERAKIEDKLKQKDDPEEETIWSR